MVQRNIAIITINDSNSIIKILRRKLQTKVIEVNGQKSQINNSSNQLINNILQFQQGFHRIFS